MHGSRTVHGSGPGLLLAHGAGGGIAANLGPIMDGFAARHPRRVTALVPSAAFARLDTRTEPAAAN